MLWRAFDKTVRNPLAFAVDAGYRNSIDLDLEVICKDRSCAKTFVSDVHQSTALAFTPVMVRNHSSFLFQAQIRLHLYTRQHPTRQRPRSDGQTGI